MCESTPDQEYLGVGVTPWSGSVVVIEQCQRCGSYRARKIDPNSIPVESGSPNFSNIDFDGNDSDRTDDTETSTETTDDTDDDPTVITG